ncbi:MAG: hypothetical protein H6667_21055 [Ardenticatenaceae bacterium]|nr:hypothetical protein [Ardenticatenaceae bacterium]MCB9445036.1 hypothetical protein [Ardenticatenaceae bacterium]
MSEIKDNTNLQKLENDVESLSKLGELLDSLGIEFDHQFLATLRTETFQFVTLADKFNAAFSQHGWIATEDISTKLMEKALEIFHSRGLVESEKYLCESFDDDYFALHSHRMKALWVWKNSERENLLRLAFEDHKNQRYHASTPVVLAQIDGLAFDINKNTFFNHKKSSLILENSVAAHETGLNTLSKISGKPRTKTQSNPIRFPYRHGILHGRDLAYANRAVSTKSFFALFAMRPWALRCQQSELSRQQGLDYEEIPGFTPGDLLQSIIQEMLKS